MEIRGFARQKWRRTFLTDVWSAPHRVAPRP